MNVFLGLGLLTILAFVCLADLRERRVPNVAVLAVLVLYAAAAMTEALGPDRLLLADLAVGLAILAACIPLWLRGWLGGGDAKLLGALGLWAGPQHALDFVLWTALAGGGLALATMAVHAHGWWVREAARTLVERLWRPAPSSGTASGEAVTAPTLPYAVAIAGGAVLSLAPQFVT